MRDSTRCSLSAAATAWACRLRVGVLAVAASAIVTATPVFASPVGVGDPDEALIPNTGGDDMGGGTAGSYDCSRLVLDDTDSVNLVVQYDYYGTDVAIDNGAQIANTLWLDKWFFDQDPDRVSTTPQGMAYDFRIVWYGTPHEPGQPDLNTVKLFGEWSLLWSSTTAAAISGDLLSLSVPWDALTDESGTNLAFETGSAACFNYHAMVDNQWGAPDDLVPNSGVVSVAPEPTGVALLGGLALGLLGWRRRCREGRRRSPD